MAMNHYILLVVGGPVLEKVSQRQMLLDQIQIMLSRLLLERGGWQFCASMSDHVTFLVSDGSKSSRQN
jgi:hypothetical protein